MPGNSRAQTPGGTQKPHNLMEGPAKKEQRATDPSGVKEKKGNVEEEAGEEEIEEEEITAETLRGKPRPLPISALPAFSYIPPRHQGPKERSYFGREGQVSRFNRKRGGLGWGGDKVLTIREDPEGGKERDEGGASVLGRGLGRGHTVQGFIQGWEGLTAWDSVKCS